MATSDSGVAIWVTYALIGNSGTEISIVPQQMSSIQLIKSDEMYTCILHSKEGTSEKPCTSYMTYE